MYHMGGNLLTVQSLILMSYLLYFLPPFFGNFVLCQILQHFLKIYEGHMVCMPLCLYRPFIHCIEGLFNCDAFYPSSKISIASKHASKQFIFPSFCHIVDRNFTHMHIVYPIKLIFCTEWRL